MNPRVNSAIAGALLLLLLLYFLSDSQQPPPLPLQRTSPYWMKIKALFTHAQSYLFPPNLDFRGSNDESAVNGIEGGAGDKVKEAVAKSLGKGKAAVEESAKSAANLVKETLSSEQHPIHPHHEPEEL